jgi:hypothetical protein
MVCPLKNWQGTTFVLTFGHPGGHTKQTISTPILKRSEKPLQSKKKPRIEQTAKSKTKAKNPPAKKGGSAATLAAKVFGRSDAPQTVQQSIPYKEMYKDGICRVTDKLYTKTIMFNDLNYQLAQNEDKTAIFEGYCDFLNYFDSSVTVQLSFINQHCNRSEFEQAISFPDMGDEWSGIRVEYADMLKNQLAKGNNGIIKRKYITFGVESDSLKTAKSRIERVEADITANFKALGVSVHTLNGLERLEVLHGQMHPDGHDVFQFNWKDIPETGMSTKDFIAPTSFEFRDGKSFRIGQQYGAVSFVQILAPELTDRMLADYLDIDTAITINMHIKAIDQAEAIKTIKRKISDLDAMKIAEQKKAVRAGYDMDIIPSDLATFGTEAKSLLAELQS